LGITAFVLKYRLPPTEGETYQHPVPLSDIQRAIRIVRALPPEIDLQCDRIGVMGFSAGGHLAATASTLYDRPVRADSISCTPDFAMLVYSVIHQTGERAHAGSHVNLLGRDASPELTDLLTPYKQVTSESPPMFLAHAKDDGGVPYQNSVLMHDALRAHGVDSELHLYDQGGHGFGLGSPEHDSSQWPVAAEAWLRARGLA
jgi:acetyl esterase/lipase